LRQGFCYVFTLFLLQLDILIRKENQELGRKYDYSQTIFPLLLDILIRRRRIWGRKYVILECSSSSLLFIYVCKKG